MSEDTELRTATRRTLKWNSIDRFSSQILYAITGIVLANVLSKEDFGLVGVLLVFQAFGILFVDSGFGAALLQKKEPTDEDYSTVFWFNLGVSILIYTLLYFAAPLIAAMFHHTEQLIPLSRLMFLSFILNGLGIVQTNRLMKAMDVKQIAVANLLGLIVSGAAGIWLALAGYGAWAIVWQTIILAAFKSGWLWVTGKWRPRLIFSKTSLSSIYRIGLGVFTSSMLNTIFLHIYTFVIGFFNSLAALGVYTQADKWSKMGNASLSQIITATYVPLLARFQDNADEFRAMMKKVSRNTSLMAIPFLGLGACMAAPLFHLLFGNKWDAAIPLFQILMIRGILIVFIAFLSNCLLSLGHAKSLVIIETIKDGAILIAIACTLPFGSIEALVWGQLAASVITFIYVTHKAAKATGQTIISIILNLWHYLLPSLPAFIATIALLILPWHPIALLASQCGAAIILFVATLYISGDDTLRYNLNKIIHRKLP